MAKLKCPKCKKPIKENMQLNEWQLNQIGCECLIHRYHIAHICSCGKLLSHSQGDWEVHKNHKMISFNPIEYRHGTTAKEVYDRLIAFGYVLGGGTEEERAVYDYFAKT